MILEEYSTLIQKTIEEGKPFSLKFYLVDDEVEKKLEKTINVIMDHYKHTELSGVIYTSLKELMINASKANIKRILFEKNNLDINNNEDYVKGMIKFRDILDEKNSEKYLQDLKDRNLWIMVRFTHSIHGLKIELFNNSKLTKMEDDRLREKLRKAMGYEDLVQFYMEQGDEIEGAGMGVALIIMLLKGLNINPSNFRIGKSVEGNTVGRIEIPFDSEYITERDKKSEKDRVLE